MSLSLFYLALLALLPSLILAHDKSDSSSCSAAHSDCLGNFFNISSIVDAFLDINATKIFENGLANQSSCAAVSVLFARGTLEVGMLMFQALCHLTHEEWKS